ncbi:glucan endo-1,3-beta-glucosidase 7 [Physcomitrium patens]|uniref:X8 domain-containing protein n=1 Tax=Physcomitrium patens TaxID=3218 RepID=A0A2K1IY61_PHYPA|nr:PLASMODESMATA CALLOSE-BINDING PROTEIN 5-like [Physcomitrium patens]PNR34213.1 hypothetical protein PHYPA_024030 [Physcomitrium patens]|eukprot:XP_024356621.1 PLASMODESMATA CALLOSE-BINDING PROTEIN 5-like [Physcomitrella patens]
MRIAMANQCGVVALSAVLLFLPLLGVALGERSETDLTFDVSMITLDKQSYNYRAQERKLATSFVWCIAKTNVSDTDLQSSLDWACGPGTDQGQVNCGPVQVGGSCYDPNTLYNHASWAFNAYFQRMNAIDEACVFAGTAQKTTVDPSTGTCIFPGSNVTTNGNLTGNGTFAPANSPGGAPGSLGSPSAATAGFEPRYFLRASTAVTLLTYLFL